MSGGESAGGAQVWSQRQQALRQADSIQQKSLDTVGLQELIRRESIGDDGSAPGDGGAQRTLSAERGVQRTPSVEAASARPPFAKFNSRRMDEKWCVMNPELQELASIDVVRCDGYQMPVADISVNTADNTVAVASMSGEAHIFSIKDGKVRGSVSEPVRLPLTSIAHNYDGTLLATGAADKILRVFSLKADNKEIASSQAHQAFVTCVAFARRNRTLLASGGGDKPIVRIWEVKEAQDASGQGELFERCVLVGHWAFVSGLAFSHDDSCVVSCCLNGTIRMWDVAHGEPMVNMSFASSVVQDRSCMQVDMLQHITHREMEDELVSDGCDDRFIWERKDLGKPLRLCRVPDVDGWGRQVEARYQYVDVENGEVIYTSSGWLRTLKGHCGAVNHVDWSPDGQHLVSSGDDGTVRIWDAQRRMNEDVVLDDRFLEGTEGHHVLAIEDEMVAGEDCTMRIEADEVVDFQIIFSQEGGYYKQHGETRAYNSRRTRRPNCQFVDRFRNPVYKIVRKADNKVIFNTDFSKFTLRGHQGPVMSTKFWGSNLLSVSHDGTLRMWQIASQECLFVVASPARYPLNSLELCEEEEEVDQAVLVGDVRGGFTIIFAENFNL
eukprot:Tamp_07325.p1 GENE.Tamp_07325~~Tamp_07325.p1  ORF type:complete len:627 (-),score=146.56 Tamp_07325:642-2471(-)